MTGLEVEPSAWAVVVDAAGLPTVDDPGGRVVVLSAHPDDEVIALGRWLTTIVDRPVRFVTATDGEASHPHSPTVTPDDLRRRRPPELVAALRAVGHHEPDVVRLGLHDAALSADHDELASRVEPLLRDADLVVSPWRHDGHADHDVVGQVAAALTAGRVPLWEYPVWTWAWRPADADASWLERAHLLPSPATASTRKARALDAFTTQVRPLSDDPADAAVVDGALLEHALRGPEVVLT